MIAKHREHPVGLVAMTIGGADFVGRRRWTAGCARNVHAIRARLLHAQGQKGNVHVGRKIIAGVTDLIEQLLLDGRRRDAAISLIGIALSP